MECKIVVGRTAIHNNVSCLPSEIPCKLSYVPGTFYVLFGKGETARDLGPTERKTMEIGRRTRKRRSRHDLAGSLCAAGSENNNADKEKDNRTG